MSRFLSTTILLLLTTLNINAASLIFGDGGIYFLWEDNDRVGFLTSTGLQIGFGMQIIADDGHCASTTGYGWSLKADTRYYAYAPYNVSYSVNEDTAAWLPVSYAGQQQNGNDNTEHLKSNVFLCGSVSANSTSAANVQLRPMTSVLRITDTFPKETTITSIQLHLDVPLIPLGGYMNLIDESFTATELASSISIKTENLNVAGNEPATVYVTLPPCDLSGSTLAITFHCADGTHYTKDLDGFNIERGQTYSIGEQLEPTTAKTYTPLTDGTLSNPTVISNDMPIAQSFIPTNISTVHATAQPTPEFDLSGRRNHHAYRNIVIQGGKKIIKN